MNMKKKLISLLLGFASIAAAESYCERTVKCQDPCDGEYSESYAEDMMECQIQHERASFWMQNGCDLGLVADDCNLLDSAVSVKASSLFSWILP